MSSSDHKALWRAFGLMAISYLLVRQLGASVTAAPERPTVGASVSAVEREAPPPAALKQAGGPRWLPAAALLSITALSLAVATAFWQISDDRYRTAVASALTGGDPTRAPPLLRRYGCSGCHTIPGAPGADGQVAPSLAEIRKRVFIGGVVRNAPGDLVRWIVSPQTFSPDSAMPSTGITADEARDVAAFLYAH